MWVYNGTIWVSDSYASPFGYLIFSDPKDSNKIKARNLKTGAIDYSNASTSPAATINSAIAALTTGGTVVLQGGTTYNTETTISIPTGSPKVELTAERGAILKPISTMTSTSIDVEAVDALVHNLVWDGTNVTTGTPICMDVGVSTSAARARILNNYIISPYTGIVIETNAPQSTVFGNILSARSGGSSWGIELNSVVSTSVLNNYLSGPFDSAGIAVRFANETRIIGNEVTGVLYGIYHLDSNYTVIQGNQLYLNIEHGIYSIISATGPYYGLVISGNNIFNNSKQTNNTYDGIRLDSSTGSVSGLNITDNNIFDNQGTHSQKYAINMIQAIYTNTIIANNNCAPGNQGSPVILLPSALDPTVRLLNNVGYNPVGALTNPFPTSGAGNIGNVAQAAAVPASTTVQTVVNTPKTIIMTGGVVTVVAINGTTLDTSAGNYIFKLGLGETFSITYSVAPTISVYCE